MKTNKKPTTARPVLPSPNRPAGSVGQLKPVVAQLKSSPATQSTKRPIAPPVYRPQAVPKVLQTKSAIAQTRNPAQPPSRPVAPQSFRPQVKHVVQPKAVVQPRVAAAPPVYQSKHVNAVIQRAEKPKYGVELKEPVPDKLEYDASSDGTTCVLIVWRPNKDQPVEKERRFASGGSEKLHAEEKAINHLKWMIAKGKLKPNKSKPNYLAYFHVSKSPCSSESVPKTRDDGNPGCHERLQELENKGLKPLAAPGKITFGVIVAATKPYYGKVAGGKAASIEMADEFDSDVGGFFPFLRGGKES